MSFFKRQKLKNLIIFLWRISKKVVTLKILYNSEINYN
jgi:hypothetical protein